MSFEECEEALKLTSTISMGKSIKEIFFEIEEYRSEIYLYLREHEVVR